MKVLLIMELEVEQDLNAAKIKERAVEVARMAEIFYEGAITQVRAGETP